MKTEDEIRTQIKHLTESNQHVLDCGPATFDVNSPRALMQTCTISVLDALYWVLCEKRPRFVCDDMNKRNY